MHYNISYTSRNARLQFGRSGRLLLLLLLPLLLLCYVGRKYTCQPYYMRV